MNYYIWTRGELLAGFFCSYDPDKHGNSIDGFGPVKVTKMIDSHEVKKFSSITDALATAATHLSDRPYKILQLVTDYEP